MNNNQNSYLPIEITTWIKAFAILLIVIGHNHILCPKEPTLSSQYVFLYKFHVSLFFILPFFYMPKESLDIKIKIINIIIRTIIPFVFIYTFSFVLYKHISHNNFGWLEFVQGFIGYGYNEKDVCGFTFPWFLPAFMIFSLVRTISIRKDYLNK